MKTRWAVYSIILGIIALGLGGFCIYGAAALSGNSADAFSVILLICGALGAAGGILGIAGGALMDGNKSSARGLLTAAAVCLLPFAFIFFIVFMMVRNRANQQGWEDEEQ